MDKPTVLEGVVSIVAALDAQSRPLERLLIQSDKRTRSISFLRRRAMDASVPIDLVSATEIDALAGGNSHGGVVAIVGERRFQSVESLVVEAKSPFIVMLDGIEDPFNFGYAVRAVYASGADGLIVRPRNWLSAAGTVARASAGASERIPTAVAESAEEAAESVRRFDLKVACTAREGAKDLYHADLSVPLFLVIGGEKRGITRSFIECADILLNIPYGRPFAQSMGTAAATSVLAFEVMRQRMSTKSKGKNL